jgi:hypothetical protein
VRNSTRHSPCGGGGTTSDSDGSTDTSGAEAAATAAVSMVSADHGGLRSRSSVPLAHSTLRKCSATTCAAECGFGSGEGTIYGIESREAGAKIHLAPVGCEHTGSTPSTGIVAVSSSTTGLHQRISHTRISRTIHSHPRSKRRV